MIVSNHDSLNCKRQSIMETKRCYTFCFQAPGFCENLTATSTGVYFIPLFLKDMSVVNTDISIFMIVYHTLVHPVKITIVCFPRNFYFRRNFETYFSHGESPLPTRQCLTKRINVCIFYKCPRCSDIIIFSPRIIPLIRKQYKPIRLTRRQCDVSTCS